jgi:AraC-like DNA-binding protein
MARLPPAFSRLSGLGPLPRLFEAEEGPAALRRLLASQNIDLDAMAPSTPVPFANLNEVFNRATRQTGDALFPLRIAQAMQPEDYGPMVVYALNAPTLGASIRRLHSLVTLQSSATGFKFSEAGGEARWSLDYHSAYGQQVNHHALHVLAPMIRIVRRYAGAAAQPTAINLGPARDGRHRIFEKVLEVPVRTGVDDFSLIFPAEWLRMSRPAGAVGSRASYSEMLAYYQDHDLPPSFTDTVASLLVSMIGQPEVDLDVIASKLNVGRRSLQQRLGAEGSSFRDISLDVRIRRAKELIRSGRESMSQVALMVGYSDQAHFARAFKALTGLTPQEFRRINRPGIPVAAE